MSVIVGGVAAAVDSPQDWFVDALCGDNRNHGRSIDKPLATFKELASRLSLATEPFEARVLILTDLADGDVVSLVGPRGSSILVQGLSQSNTLARPRQLTAWRPDGVSFEGGSRFPAEGVWVFFIEAAGVLAEDADGGLQICGAAMHAFRLQSASSGCSWYEPYCKHNKVMGGHYPLGEAVSALSRMHGLFYVFHKGELRMRGDRLVLESCYFG